MLHVLRFVVVVGTTVVLASCSGVSTGDFFSMGRESLPDTPAAWASAQETIGDVQVGWIDALEDQALSKLVQEAQQNNKDLQAAATNVERSWAYARQAGAALKPSVNLTSGGSRSGVLDSGSSAGSMSLGAQLNWELDVWGRIRSGKAAAVASAEAAEADYRYTQHSLAAAVSRAYFLAIEAGLQSGVTRKSLEALKETNRIVSVRYQDGLASSQDLAVSNSDLASMRAQQSAADGAKRDALRALEVLLGRYPAADLEIRTSLPKAPPSPPAGIPSEILERRPDLVSAERRVAAAFNRVDEAKAAKLPSISLTSNVGGTSNQLSSLLNPSNIAWSLGTSLLAPLFDGGARDAQVDIATADQEQALASYGQVALNAFREVESGLDQLDIVEEQNSSLALAASEARKALKIAQLRYDEGETDLLDVLSIQQRVINTESGEINIDRSWLDQWINLNLALGGSW